MTVIGIAGIVAALAFFMFAAMKGYTPLITAPIAALIIILTNGMDVTQYMLTDPTNSMFAGMGACVMSFALLFVLASIIGKYIDTSGAAVTIARKIMKIAGEDNPFMILCGVALVTMLLTYGGVSLFVVMFAVIPISRPLFKAADLPWHLFVAPFSVGATGITMTLLPGTPSLTLLTACQACGVTLTSAPVISLFLCVIVLVASAFYFKWAIKRCREKGEHYDCRLPESEVKYDNLPSFGVSVTPLVALIVIIIVGSILKVDNIVYIGMIAALVLCMVLFNKNITVSHKEALGTGAEESLGPLLFTSTGIGLGGVAAASPGFLVIADAIFAMPGGSLVSAAVMSFALGAAAGGGLAAVNVLTANFLSPMLASGANPAILAKVMTVAACIGGGLPNAGPIFGILQAMGLTHKEGYRHIWWLNIVLMFVVLVILIAVGSVIAI